MAQLHQPIAYLYHVLHFSFGGLTVLLVSKISFRHGLVIPSLAKLVVVLKKLQLFYYVVHYKARVDGKLLLLWSALILLYCSHMAS